MSNNETNILDNLTNTAEYDDDAAVSKNLDNVLDNSVANVSKKDVSAKTPEETSLKFRNRLTDAELESVKAAAPKLSQKFLDNTSAIIEFGGEVMEGVNSINTRLLDEQSDTDIPEADVIVNGILREIDGYSAKYNDPKMSKMIQKIIHKFKGTGYTLKAMVRDSKPIAEKLTIASGQLQKMEYELRDNVLRGHELRKATLKALNDMVKVLAVFEEVLEVTRNDAQEMDKALKVAEAGDANAVVIWKDKTYSVEEFREILGNQTTTLGEIEKSWFAWRQKYFLYGANVTATRNIINMSFGLQRTCQRVRVDAIPAARSQLVVWQQAEKGRQGARMAESANKGIDRLIAGAAEGTASAVAEVAEANQRNMLSEETILKVTQGIRDQFAAIVEAEKNGRAVRARNLAIIQQSEQNIKVASDDARTALIESAMATVRADAEDIKKADTQDVLNQLGV